MPHKKYNLNLEIFIKEVVLFAIAMGAGILVALNYVREGLSGYVAGPLSLSLSDILWAMLFVILFSVLLYRYDRVAGLATRLFFVIIILSGAQLVFGALLSPDAGFLLALLLILVLRLFPYILTHNLAVLLGVSGVSALLGVSLSPTMAVILLAVLSIYDVIAVYKTKHMVVMAKNMIKSGAIFGFLVPATWDGFLRKTSTSHSRERFTILGSGDIGLPIVMVSSLAVYSLAAAIFTGFFSVIGLFITHLIFTNQKERRPMAALPPIATLTIVGFLIFQLVA